MQCCWEAFRISEVSDFPADLRRTCCSVETVVKRLAAPPELSFAIPFHSIEDPWEALWRRDSWRLAREILGWGGSATLAGSRERISGTIPGIQGGLWLRDIIL